MNQDRIERVLGMFERRGEIEPLPAAGLDAARVCVSRADDRVGAARVLTESGHLETAFTSAYDAYRMAAESVVLAAGYRVPAVPGAHRITFDVARAGFDSVGNPFADVTAERFRRGRHESEYFDPERPAEKSSEDVAWALDKATAAVAAVRGALGVGGS